ncbi:dTDP-4-dehydrorhamnose 3,5-epimerase [Pseudomonas fragi]|uniref:dTDP-4-dehydrorhamnose 3,5-epimerase n=1 Tax=Pseudomonas fragi TaxID=296 RepID=UPI0021C099B3|nr:dTDP-4-dehydrorhamnose 3,5-epimerase [Pseudomonas fragi]UXL40116.1 dTDP-4-dehydrorhamnose 3,5-epimerase [Pseudomonas fragi]
MKFTEAQLPGVVIIEPDVYEDERGWFMESFNQKRFEEGLQSLGQPIPKPFVQDNQSCSKKGVLRGLHYQLEPFAQGKLVSVSQGAAFDVAVDLRTGSPTFGKWLGIELNATNKKMLWIPAGFAHGFLALEDKTYFSYKTTDFYNKDSERSLFWNDPVIGVEWPSSDKYYISTKDLEAPRLSVGFVE